MLHKASPLLKAAASPAYLAKGCVNVIELGSLREQAGDRWPRICEGVYARTEALLRSKLSPNDLFIRMGEIAYLVTMPMSEADDVNAICMRVAYELHMTFLGQCGLDKIEIDMVTTEDGDSFVLQRLPYEKVVRLAERAGIPSESSGPSNQAGPEQYSQSANGTANFESDAKKDPTSARLYDEPSPRALMIEFQFVPIWSTRNSAVTTYGCEPKTIIDARRRDTVHRSYLIPKECIQIEISAFQSGLDHLIQSLEEGTKFLLAVPISFEVLGWPVARMEFLSTCRNISQAYRDYLIFVLFGVPPGVAQSRLANMVSTLRPFGRGVSATISPTDRAFASYQGIGLQSIGFDLQEFGPRIPFQQKDAEQLAQFARRSGMGTFLSNVQDKNTLKYAQDAQIAQMSGPAIAPATPNPRGMWRLTWADTLAKPAIEIWD